jgi:tRNA A37 N6-isopentenylltransferase MiaA
MAKMRSAWPVHLASVRRHFFDHIEPGDIVSAAKALSEVAAHLEDSSVEPRERR